MSDKSDNDKHLQQTLATLDQLGETLDVMSGVVERLRLHMHRQLAHNRELFRDEAALADAELEDCQRASRQLRDDSFVVEISQQELEDGIDPVIH